MLKKCMSLKYKKRTFFYAGHCLTQQSNARNEMARYVELSSMAKGSFTSLQTRHMSVMARIMAERQVANTPSRQFATAINMSGVAPPEKPKMMCTWERLNNADKPTPSTLKLTDQSIDSKVYMKRYLAYTQRPGVQYESMIDGSLSREQQLEEAGSVEQRVSNLRDFNSVVEIKQQEILQQSLSLIDKKNFLIKGVLIHWSIKLKEENPGQGTDIMKGFETKFPLLIGDQYHSMAYFMITRVGNVELTRLLTMIEENFWKIFYNMEKFPADLTANIEFIYSHFYNYLPQFMGNTFNGLGVIFDLDKESLVLIRDAGIELGYFFQFGIFSYIMTAIINQTKKAEVKEQLQKISSILQYLSFETMESMLYSMKSLNLVKFQTEFMMLTMFHASEFNQKIDQMPLEEHVKNAMKAQVDDFLSKLFELAEFDPNSVSGENASQFTSEVRLARDTAILARH